MKYSLAAHSYSLRSRGRYDVPGDCSSDASNRVLFITVFFKNPAESK